MKRPQPLTPEELSELRKKHGVTDEVFLVGVRGFFKEMASPEFNDRGVYDDVIYLVNPHVPKAYNANTDPSRYQPGIAYLQPGIWLYRVGIHNQTKAKSKQYEALVQAAKVQIKRDGQGDEPAKIQEGYFGINIHKGGYSTTASEGCQTIYPDQWVEFMNDIKVNMADAKLKTIKYLLVDQT